MTIPAFPKIFAIGTTYISSIFNSEVEISEKIDGSQFAFGMINGKLCMRSKRTLLYRESPEKMFKHAIDWIYNIQDVLPENIAFYAEYLQKPKHNTLKYNRIPENHLMLFGAMHTDQEFIIDHTEYAHQFGIEPVPILYKGIASSLDIEKYLQTKSVLGGQKIEGIVVKNYNQQFFLGGQPIPIMAGKYVSKEFKEIHNKGWKEKKTTSGKFQTYIEGFRTEARWEKAIQHLRDSGKLLGEPRDIGNLIKEVKEDITTEAETEIKEFLWDNFKDDILRKSVARLPEWYKKNYCTNKNT